METAGVRELRQHASRLLRRVGAGETIEITDRGRPVAVLAPLPGAGPLQHLRATGEVSAATGELTDLPAPMRLPAGAASPSEALRRLRRDER